MTVKVNTPEEREQYRKMIEAFVLQELDPIGEEIERTGVLPDPDPIMLKLREKELFRLRIPKEWGGEGLPFAQWLPILEMGGKGHGTIRNYFHAPSAVWRSTYLYGTDEQKKKWLPRAAEGTYRAFGLTEPVAGSGVDIDTTAVRKGDTWVINGKKHLISNSGFWPATDVVVRTGDKSLKEKALSIIIVEKDTPGFIIEPMPRAMGFHKLYTLTFKDCVVPYTNLLGKEGDGHYITLRSFMDLFRLSTSTCIIGSCQRMLELSVAYSRKRVTFGKPIAQRQAIQQMLAEMAIDIHAARLIVHDAGRKHDAGTFTPALAGMSKSFAVEMSQRVSDKAILIHGGVGYTQLHKIERMYRDVRAMWFEEGTPTIQKMMVARELLGQ